MSTRPPTMAKELYIHTQGRGPDLVLVHGWGLHGGVWAPVLDALRRRYRVSVVDLPGHGRSPYTGSFALGDVVEQLQAQTPEAALWLGWSLGGLIAQALAGTAPERVRALVLVASSPRFVQGTDWPAGVPGAVFTEFERACDEDYAAAVQRFLVLNARGGARARESLAALRGQLAAGGLPQAAALRDGLRLLCDTDLRAALPHVACPTLWLFGERDTIVPARTAAAVRELQPGAACRLMKGAGHVPFLSDPAAFVHHVTAFAAAQGA